MISPVSMVAALRNQAEGIYCLEAATELLIAQVWLHRTDFTGRVVITADGVTDGRPMAAVDWSAVIAALDSGQQPCTGGERRMLRLTASLADGIPVDLRESLTGLDRNNLRLLITAAWRASGQRLPVPGW